MKDLLGLGDLWGTFVTNAHFELEAHDGKSGPMSTAVITHGFTTATAVML